MKEFYTTSLNGLIFLRDHFEALVAIMAIALLTFTLYTVVDKVNTEPMLKTNTTFVDSVVSNVEKNITIVKDDNLTETVNSELVMMEVNKTIISDPIVIPVAKQPEVPVKKVKPVKHTAKKHPRHSPKKPKKHPRHSPKKPKKSKLPKKCKTCNVKISKSVNSKTIVTDLSKVYNYKHHTTTEDIWNYQKRIQDKHNKKGK